MGARGPHRLYSKRHQRRLAKDDTAKDLQTLFCNDYSNTVDDENLIFCSTLNNDSNADEGDTVLQTNEGYNTDLSNTYDLPINMKDIEKSPELNNQSITKNTEHETSNGCLLCFKDELQLWAVSHSIPQNAVTDLLGILRHHTSYVLPKDCRTLLKTPRAIEILQLGNGSYCHIGLKELLVNIDGLPISKSSSAALWPILCSDDTFTKRVYIIGAFFGKQKPVKANEYLQSFVEEVKDLINTGIEINHTEHTEGPMMSTMFSYKQYKTCRYRHFYINCTNDKDNCFMLKDDTTVVIQNILQDIQDGKIFVVGEKMTCSENFYTSPCNSSDLGIAVADSADHTLYSWSLDELKSKLWRVAYGENYVLLPLLHF
nr:unnamed protein product [Callosobruchus analis]